MANENDTIDRINCIIWVLENVSHNLFYDQHDFESELAEEEISKREFIKNKIHEMLKIAVLLPKPPNTKQKP